MPTAAAVECTHRSRAARPTIAGVKRDARAASASSIAASASASFNACVNLTSGNRSRRRRTCASGTFQNLTGQKVKTSTFIEESLHRSGMLDAVGFTGAGRKELAANYADYANGAHKKILDAPHSRNPRNSRLILFFPIKQCHPSASLCFTSVVTALNQLG